MSSTNTTTISTFLKPFLRAAEEQAHKKLHFSDGHVHLYYYV